jgi:hypothetical protein
VDGIFLWVFSGSFQEQVKEFSSCSATMSINGSEPPIFSITKETLTVNKFTLAALSIVALGASVSTSAEAFRPVTMPTLVESATPVLSTAQLAQAPGQFTTVEQDHPTTGTARVVTENGQRYLEFDAAFDTARGPLVEVILYTGAEIPVNIAETDYITIAPLQSFEGAQRYLIPADVDLNDYQTVGIWCREFNVTFGYAPL